tara:strand:+ start:7078 stop:7581 length:504 start_codon:yes stop_codon:yes gene_type:complete
MPTTYELLTDAGKLLAAIEDCDGELTEDSIDEIDGFLIVADDKLGAIKAVITRFKSEIVLHKQWRDHHANRARSLAKTIDRLTHNGTGLLEAMVELGEEPKVKAEWGSVSLRTSYVTTVAENLEDVDVRYLVEQPPKVDKASAKKAIQAGEQVAGITLTENRKAVWR